MRHLNKDGTLTPQDERRVEDHPQDFEYDVLLLTKRTPTCEMAINLTRYYFGSGVTVLQGDAGDHFPSGLPLTTKHYDYIFSFLSPWILSQYLLERGKMCLNFHPGSSKYPGTGCYNFAIYDKAKYYGCVCHSIASAADVGAIHFENLFPVPPSCTVVKLKELTMITMLELYQRVLGKCYLFQPLPIHARQWQRKPYTMRDFDKLKQITHNMGDEEIARRIFASEFPGYPGAYVTVCGKRFYAKRVKDYYG